MTTETRPKPIEPHETHSRRLFQHAKQQLEKGDRLQASEKAWGAVAHRVKVIANRMNWQYDQHSDFNKLKKRIASLTDDPKLTGLLIDKARFLHVNYYKDVQQIKHLREDLDEIKELLEILDGPQFRKPKPRTTRARRRGGGSEIGGMGGPIVTSKKHRAERSRAHEDKPPSQASLDRGKR